MTETLAAILGALLGALGAYLVTLSSARRSERIALTLALITEFYSVEFLQHRISVHETWQRNRRGEVDIARVAAGF